MSQVRLDEFGREIPDSTPLRLPAGFKRPETLAEQVQRLVRTHISRMAEEEGYETFEDADDFEVDDEFDPSTPYEMFFDPVLGREISAQQMKENSEFYKQEYLRRQKDEFEQLDIEQYLRDLPRARRDTPPAEPLRPGADAPGAGEASGREGK